MPKITLELLRKRVEHNEGEIHSVEELALHQEKIEKLENLDKWCRKLKILLLQNNLIAKIENISRLKELEYLNLALNNVEKIENLEGCESLSKLDLTLNFIGEITSVMNLRHNYFLESLYLTGNPCVDFPGYRQYVLNCLPQLKTLDGVDITMTERLIARQEARDIEDEIIDCEIEYKARRHREKSAYNLITSDKENADGSNGDEDNIDGVIDTDDYWNQMTPNTPEVRTELTLHNLKLEEKSRNAKSSTHPKNKEKKEVTLFFPDGRPRNINEGKMSFSLHDEQEQNIIVLDLAVPKYLDSSLIKADVQPMFTTCAVKGKIFQIVLPEEVKPDSSIAQRSKTTGHLVITMPKLNQTSEIIWKGSAYYGNEGSQKVNSLIENAVSRKPKPLMSASARKLTSLVNQPQKESKRQRDLHNNENAPETAGNLSNNSDDEEGKTSAVDWRNIIPEKDVNVAGGEGGVEAEGESQRCTVKTKQPNERGENDMMLPEAEESSTRIHKSQDPQYSARNSPYSGKWQKTTFADNADVPPLI